MTSRWSVFRLIGQVPQFAGFVYAATADIAMRQAELRYGSTTWKLMISPS